MKKFILVFVMLPFFVMAQNYYPIVKDGGIWRETVVQLVNPPDQFSLTKIQYSTMGDTIINNTAYKKIYSMDYDSIINNLQYMGAIREDSMRHVYALLVSNSPISTNDIINDSSETLIYDFNLMVGDTFLVSGNQDSLQIVNTIDSVLVAGLWRRRINFLPTGLSTRIWIEGIGDTKGLFFPALFEFENHNTLTCYEDKNIFWTNPELSQYSADCFTVGIAENAVKQTNKSKVYPNPATSTISIEFKTTISESFTVTIYNLLGQQVKEVAVAENQNHLILSLNGLKKGIYFYKLHSDDIIIGSGKFIKE